MGKNRGSSGGFTLLELMIVLAIIGLLVALALPAYLNYSIRTKVSEGLSIGAAAKMALEETCQSDATVNIATQTGYQFQASKYVSNMNFLGNCNIMVIAITTQNTGAPVDQLLWLYRPGQLAGPQFFTIPLPQTQSWYCFGWPSQLYIPSSCRLQNINN